MRYTRTQQAGYLRVAMAVNNTTMYVYTVVFNHTPYKHTLEGTYTIKM